MMSFHIPPSYYDSWEIECICDALECECAALRDEAKILAEEMRYEEKEDA